MHDMNAGMRSKRNARAEARKRAAKLTGRKEREARIQDTLRGLMCVERGGRVFVYYPAGHEPDLRAYYRDLLKRGVRLCFPRADGGRMSFHAVSSLRALARGRFGIPAPPRASPEQIPGADDILLVPALAFDASGTRIGRGLGYFDRYFSAHPDGFRVGVCFESQLTGGRLPHGAHDVPVHLVVTDAAARFIA